MYIQNRSEQIDRQFPKILVRENLGQVKKFFGRDGLILRPLVSCCFGGIRGERLLDPDQEIAGRSYFGMTNKGSLVQNTLQPVTPGG